ncbi:hypothetical protein PR048_006352 [Dryococelus australis]|uniref:Uncharacterized protein n=1 Tax=Dryococelus australis TaxID=614101 RepID=A0ABQ9IBE6_9NEOP|nr:hypothetical protein PR048_006352 [Dryococelus australis]
METEIRWLDRESNQGFPRTIVPPQSMRVNRGEYGEAPECKGGENGKSPRKPRGPAASPGMISTRENPRATLPGIEPGSPRYEASLDQVLLLVLLTELGFCPIQVEPRWCGGQTTLASHQGEQGSIPGEVAPRFSRVVIVPDDATDWRIFSGISFFSPHLHSGVAYFTPVGSQDLVQIFPLQCRFFPPCKTIAFVRNGANGAASECKGGGTGDPKKTRQSVASSGTIPTCGNSVIEPGSPWWEKSGKKSASLDKRGEHRLLPLRHVLPPWLYHTQTLSGLSEVTEDVTYHGGQRPRSPPGDGSGGELHLVALRGDNGKSSPRARSSYRLPLAAANIAFHSGPPRASGTRQSRHTRDVADKDGRAVLSAPTRALTRGPKHLRVCLQSLAHLRVGWTTAFSHSRLPPRRTGLNPRPVQRYDGKTERLARRSDEELGTCVSVARIARIALSLLDLGSHLRIHLCSAYETEKRGSDKVNTVTCIKCPIAAKRKALNWHAVLHLGKVFARLGKHNYCGTFPGSGEMGNIKTCINALGYSTKHAVRQMLENYGLQGVEPRCFVGFQTFYNALGLLSVLGVWYSHGGLSQTHSEVAINLGHKSWISWKSIRLES